MTKPAYSNPMHRFCLNCLSLTKKILSHQDCKRERASLYAAHRHICRAKILMWVKSISAEYFASPYWYGRAVRRLIYQDSL